MDNIEIEIVNIFLSEAEMKHINITSPLCIFHSQLPSHSFSAKSCPDYLSRNLKQHYGYNHSGNVMEWGGGVYMPLLPHICVYLCKCTYECVVKT